MVSEGLTAASLLEGGAVATPSYLLDPKHPSNGAHWPVQGWDASGDELEGGLYP